MGIGIIAGVAFEPSRDSHLVRIPAEHLFGEQTTRIAVKSGVFLRDYVHTLIAMLSPDLDDAQIKMLLDAKPGSVKTQNSE